MSTFSKIKNFISQIFKEDGSNGKYSSKKTMGILTTLLVLISYIIDGFNFYDINIEMFNSLLIFSGTMLGASMIKVFSKDKESDN